MPQLDTLDGHVAKTLAVRGACKPSPSPSWSATLRVVNRIVFFECAHAYGSLNNELSFTLSMNEIYCYRKYVRTRASAHGASHNAHGCNVCQVAPRAAAWTSTRGPQHPGR